ncbi:MAG: hypothetical protein ABIK43_04835, partial [candidate division WOR-3 bacterium]
RSRELSFAVVATRLFPGASLRLTGPVACICPDGTDLLAVEESGERILVFNQALQIRETLAMPNRLVVPRGLAAIRHYVYVYDDRTLYRYNRGRRELEACLVDVKLAGIVGYSPAEVLVSDALRGVVWRKGLWGGSRVFLDATDILHPTALAELEEGMFAVLGSAGQVIVVNRAAIVERRLVVGREFQRMSSDRKSRLIFYSAETRFVMVMDNRQQERFELDGINHIADLAVWPDRLIVLDGPSRLVVYEFPTW